MVFKHLSKKKLLLLVGDALVILLAYISAHYVRFGSQAFDKLPLFNIPIVICCYLIVYYLCDLYDVGNRFWRLSYISKFFFGNAISVALLASVLFMEPASEHRRGILIINAILVFILATLWRLSFKLKFKEMFSRKKKVVLLGSGWGVQTTTKLIENNTDFDLVDIIEFEPSKHTKCIEGTDMSACSIYKDMVKISQADVLIHATDRINCVHTLRSILHYKMKGVLVYNTPIFCEELTGKLLLEHVNDSWFISTRMLGVKPGFYNRKIKRLLDIVCSVVGLLLSLPITIFTAIAIKLDSQGPLFYRQCRVGQSDELFEIVKFRSMRVDAEANGAVWAKKGDDRVTRVGKFIRKTRIDEIPQMWNVLRGEMSFIGPRPERPEFVEVLEEKIPYYALRHSIKPGITGWAQVNYPYGASEQDSLEKLQYDLFYIKNLYPSLDAHIMLKTIKVVLFGFGAR